MRRGRDFFILGFVLILGLAIYDGLEACFTQSYGPEARGGAAGSQVIISSEPIHHPHLIEPESMIIMSQGAYAKYVPILARGGVLLIDDGLVELPASHRSDILTFCLPATRLAEQAGSVRAANTAMLGFWCAIAGAVSKEAMRHAVAESVPGKLHFHDAVVDGVLQTGLHIRGMTDDPPAWAKRKGDDGRNPVGTEPVLGMSFSDILPLFEKDKDTKAVAIFGEIGGPYEEEAAEAVRKKEFTKPLVVYVAGAWAPEGMRFSHASSIIERGKGSAKDKIKSLKEAGVHVVDRPDEIAPTLKQLLKS